MGIWWLRGCSVEQQSSERSENSSHSGSWKQASQAPVPTRALGTPLSPAFRLHEVAFTLELKDPPGHKSPMPDWKCPCSAPTRPKCPSCGSAHLACAQGTSGLRQAQARGAQVKQEPDPACPGSCWSALGPQGEHRTSLAFTAEGRRDFPSPKPWVSSRVSVLP